MAKKKEQTEMDKITAGYEDFMKRQALKENGKDQFDKAIKKAATPKKQRGSK